MLTKIFRKMLTKNFGKMLTKKFGKMLTKNFRKMLTKILRKVWTYRVSQKNAHLAQFWVLDVGRGVFRGRK